MNSSDGATIARTPRLRLREFALDDAAFIVELLNEPDWLRFIGDKGVRSLDDARCYLREGPLASYASNGFGLWAVERSDDGELLGMCGLIRRPTLEHVDVGFAFLARRRGQGYATEAVRATLECGFGRLGLARIVAITTRDNAASQRVLERAGLKREGLVRLGNGGEELVLYGASPGNCPQNTGCG